MKYRSMFILIAIPVLSVMVAHGYRYDDYSAGRSFFSDGQEWKFTRHNADGVMSDYAVTAKVLGDTVISYYMDYYGEIVRVDQPCKIIQVISDKSGVSEKRYAVYEWDAEIYVYSDKAKEFVQLLTFNKKENVKILYCGEKWQVGTVDYIYQADRLMKRCRTNALNSDKSSDWVYRIGASRLWLSENKWENPCCLEMVSYREPKGGEMLTADVFDSDTFVPDNSCYPDGREWVYNSAYYENRGQQDILVHQRVEGPEEFEHIMCKKVSYRLEDRDSEETGLVCSHDGIMYERGYMGMLMPRFDFRLEVGERALPNVPDSEVVAVDDIEVKGYIRRRLTFKGLTNDSQWKYWVQGIGANSGNDMLPREEMEDLSEIYYPGSFVRCEENGKIVFSAEDFQTPPAGVRSVNVNDEDESELVYQLNGTRVSTLRPGAIMIKSGRKYLLR